MSRIALIGLTALTLTACGPGEQTPTAEPAAPAPTPAPAPGSDAGATAPMSWEAMQDRYRQMEVAPGDPLEALEHRAVLCAHYMGEQGGEGSERDQWLNAQMETHRCEELAAEARAMRDARSDEPAVVARLETVLAQFE